MPYRARHDNLDSHGHRPFVQQRQPSRTCAILAPPPLGLMMSDGRHCVNQTPSSRRRGWQTDVVLSTSCLAPTAPLQVAFCASRHRRHVLRCVSRPREPVYPIASQPRSPRSVHPVIAATRGQRWRARGVKLRDPGGKVHRGQDLPGDVLGLDERDQAERCLATRAHDLDREGSAQEFRPRDVRRSSGWLGRVGGWQWRRDGGGDHLAARGACPPCGPIFPSRCGPRYGASLAGSSALAVMLALGLVMNVSVRRFAYQ